MKKRLDKTNSLTNDDLDKIANLLDAQFDKRLAPLVTMEFVEGKINGLETSLKAYMHEGFEAVTDGVDSLTEKLADKDRLERVVEWAIQAGDKIGVKPKF